MTNLGLLIVVTAIGASALIQVLTDPRFTGAFIAKSLLALLVFGFHVAIALVALVALLPSRADAAPGIAIAFLGWIGLGTLGLIRLAPRLREPPGWLRQVGAADLISLVLVAGGLVWAYRL